jgi:FtsP/CotA-like multicopper oxidase with cupredoxin domain
MQRPHVLLVGLMVAGCGANFGKITGDPARDAGQAGEGAGEGGGSGSAPPDTAPPDADLSPVQPPGWADGLAMREPRDLNPDPHILEIAIDARVAPVSFLPGTTTPVWTYDGGVPGPLLRLKVGDRLIVHLTNHLPEATSIHWHGLRIPVAMDGVPDMPTPAVPPGGSFTYDFTVPDAGLFWYHPHVHAAQQVGDGLYGALLVEDPNEPAGIGDELVLVLSDLDIKPDGTFVPPGTGGDVATLFGREGNYVLANGRMGSLLQARVGVRQRWRIVNTAKSRYFELVAAGQKFLRIGGDGGLATRAVELERPLVIPGERLDLVWEPRGTPGAEIPLHWVATDRGFGTAYKRPDQEILRIKLQALPPAVSPPMPKLARRIEPLDLTGATQVSLQLTRNDVDKTFQLGINGRAFEEHVQAHIGETQIWTIENLIDWAHPFHTHGFFYQVLEEDGSFRQPLEWKDTTNVPVKGKLKIAVRFDERPGMWMFHCHILDHAEAGMMGAVMLEP